MAAGVGDYSRLMRDAERATVDAANRCRKISRAAMVYSASVPPTVSPSTSTVGWPTPTGTPW
ncbi:MAG TPA: hypothetical protein QF813_00965, partial [Alphaproteobacteria bacterium]|nr:hypothetical protein [Alphaproteobacteria bacterium]